MIEDMDDIEKILWIEKRFGITKTLSGNPSSDRLEATESELIGILSRYRDQLKLNNPVPRVRMWLTNDRLNFLFFDRKSGKRIFLGDWLANKETMYER